jgi:hypothetical protein
VKSITLDPRRLTSEVLYDKASDKYCVVGGIMLEMGVPKDALAGEASPCTLTSSTEPTRP